MDVQICINESIYPITYGKKYQVIEFNPDKLHHIRIIGDNGRKIWVPACLFADSDVTVPLITQTIIRDDLEESHHSAIEVDIYLSTGERRWCFFVLPIAFGNFGDRLTINDQPVSIHHGPHQIVVTALSPDIIQATLEYLLCHGQLMEATRAF